MPKRIVVYPIHVLLMLNSCLILMFVNILPNCFGLGSLDEAFYESGGKMKRRIHIGKVWCVCVCAHMPLYVLAHRHLHTIQMSNPGNVLVVHKRFALVMTELNKNPKVML